MVQYESSINEGGRADRREGWRGIRGIYIMMNTRDGDRVGKVPMREGGTVGQ